MRSITNFLLFETIFDSIPNNNSQVYSVASRILDPSFTIVEEDCGTRLGRILSLGDSSVGKVSLLTYGSFDYQSSTGQVTETINSGDILTQSQTTALLTRYSQVATRSLSTCTSKGGICRQCIRGHDPVLYEDLSNVPPVGETYRVVSPSKTGYLTWLSERYPGGILGFQPLETTGQSPLPVREGLIRTKIPEGSLSMLYREVSKVPNMDGKFLEYANSIEDRLEKALFLILIYRFFLDVTN